MEAYRLKHIPTGLYYTPSRGSGNLSKKGKVYVGLKPKISWALVVRVKINSWKSEPKGHHKIIVDYFNLDWNNGWIDKYVKTNEQDWVIEKLN